MEIASIGSITNYNLNRNWVYMVDHLAMTGGLLFIIIQILSSFLKPLSEFDFRLHAISKLYKIETSIGDTESNKIFLQEPNFTLKDKLIIFFKNIQSVYLQQ